MHASIVVLRVGWLVCWKKAARATFLTRTSGTLQMSGVQGTGSNLLVGNFSGRDSHYFAVSAQLDVCLESRIVQNAGLI